MSELIEALAHLQQSDEYPLHMPGHKRNMANSYLSSAYGIDITEIEGYDNLYEADGILKKAMDRAARVFHAERTWFLVNGSTVGILTAISAHTHIHGSILIARNCHKSVYHACELRELTVHYIYPEYLKEQEMFGRVDPSKLDRILEENSGIEAVVITSPTYEGIVSDIAAIAEIVHKRNIPLIVDEAHGAHFSFHERFPKSALSLGADIVIQSLHKTLPAFTQTALLHAKGFRAEYEKIGKYLTFYQTSSPSYVLMAGIDECIETIEKNGSSLWNSFFFYRDTFLKQCETFKKIKIFCGNGNELSDPCKLIISVKHTTMSGRKLQEKLLRDYQIQVEMAAPTYVLCIITLCDTKEGFDRLYRALAEIEQELKQDTEVPKECENMLHAEKSCEMFETEEYTKELVLLEEADLRIAGDFINLYPPGIPLLVPGERITDGLIRQIMHYQSLHLHVQGVTDQYVNVIGNQKG